MALVEVDSVTKSYPRRAGLRTEEHPVVQDVSFSIEAGETLGLVGESGSGKTTVARMIWGWSSPAAARCTWRVWTRRASHAELRHLRRQMQPVFQNPYAALNPRIKVLDIVTEPLVIHGMISQADGDPAWRQKSAGAGREVPLVRYLSTRIAVMEREWLVETGEAETLCAQPREAYTRQLIAATPELPAGAA